MSVGHLYAPRIDIDDELDRASQAAAMERWFPSTMTLSKEDRVTADSRGLEAFCRDACRTVDEHDQDTPVKPLPLDELQYLRIFLWLFCRERLFMVPKSRQIMITWIAFICIVWRLCRSPFQKWAYVAKKKEDGQAHIEQRIKDVLWWQFPKWFTRQYTIARIKGTFLITHFRGQPWNSWLTSYPQGADQLRQFTHSGIFGDEVAFQRLFRAWWKSAVPTVGARRGKAGQIVLVSSAEKGCYFEDLLGAQLTEALAMARGEIGDFAFKEEKVA